MDIIDLTPQAEPEAVYDTRISVPDALARHFQIVLDTRDKILKDPEASESSKVAALNAATSIIKELSVMQEKVYSTEKLAILQQVIVDVLKDSSPALRDKVIEKLDQRVARL